MGSPGGGAEEGAAGGVTDARPATGRYLTFAVEASRVVVVEGRQLASEHGPRVSLWSPGLRPGEDRRRAAGGAGTGDAAKRRAGAGTLRNDGGPRQSGLRKGGAGQCPPIAAPAGGGGATSGHVDAQINFIVSFLVVQYAESG